MAACLSFVAGYVDSLGFLHLGGYFVSFMSGNSTRMSVAIADRSLIALVPAGIIALFVVGVMAGTILNNASGAAPGRRLILAISALMAVAAGLATFGQQTFAIALIPVAMGAMNTVFQRDGEVAVGVTYMTGTLVKFGQRLAAALTGRDRRGWASYLLLWLGLILGAICGAALYPHLGLSGLWIPAVALAILSFVHTPETAQQPTG